MAIISLKTIREIAEKNKETHILDLGKFLDKKLEGVCIPIKVKSLEDALQLKSDYKLKRKDLTIEYKPFSRLPKALKEEYLKNNDYRAGITDRTYIQILNVAKDETLLQKTKFRERLFNILIHLDMDYKTEEGKTLWEDCGIEKNNYNALVDLFSEIIQFEQHLDVLDILIDCIKNGNYEEKDLTIAVQSYGFRKYLDNLTPEERDEFIREMSKMQEHKELKEDNEEIIENE